MTVPERIYELWRSYGWNVEPDPRLQYRESWCHGFEGPSPSVDDYTRDRLRSSYEHGKTRLLLLRAYGSAESTVQETDDFMLGRITYAELIQRVDARCNPDAEIKVEKGEER